jgi:hypothetical protein
MGHDAIERTILDGGLCRREDMEAALMKFFWVEKIHAEKFNRLWEETMGTHGEEVCRYHAVTE